MEGAEFTFGIISLLPVLVVIVVAIITKKAADSLLLGTLIGAAIYVGKTTTASGVGVVAIGGTRGLTICWHKSARRLSTSLCSVR